MEFDNQRRVLCEQCKQPNGRLHVVDEFGTGAGREIVDDDDDWSPDYILVCYKCVSDIGSWAPTKWQQAKDNHQTLLWTRDGGQMFTSDGISENATRR